MKTNKMNRFNCSSQGSEQHYPNLKLFALLVLALNNRDLY